MATTDYSLERGLPASIDAERSILGAILLESLLFDQAAELKPDDFSLDAHRRIFSRMRDLQDAGRPVDMITLAEELDRRKEIEAIGGVAYLSSLIDGLPERPSIEHYVRIVRNKALLRGLINISSRESSSSPRTASARASPTFRPLSRIPSARSTRSTPAARRSPASPPTTRCSTR
jgi:replicative DNA helicase